jgi:hypothetical protein
MKIKNCLRFTLPFVALFAFASIASAQATPSAPTLEMTATVVTAMQLTISTDTANSGAVVTPGAANEFSIDFGDVNGLGLSSATTAAGVAVAPNGTGAVYTTPINLTPTFSGYVDGSATIKRMAGGSDDDGIALEGSSAANVAALPGTATTAFSGAADDSLHTRYVGFFIARAETTGAKTATVIYSITVQ